MRVSIAHMANYNKRISGYLLVFFGALMVSVSLISQYVYISYVGLGFIFWGIVLTLIIVDSPIPTNGDFAEKSEIPKIGQASLSQCSRENLGNEYTQHQTTPISTQLLAQKNEPDKIRQLEEKIAELEKQKHKTVQSPFLTAAGKLTIIARALPLLVAILIVGIILLVVGVFLSYYPNSVISGIQEKLNSGSLSQVDIWMYSGSLSWWNNQQLTVYQPLSDFLIATGEIIVIVSSTLLAVFYISLTIKERYSKSTRLSSANAQNQTSQINTLDFAKKSEDSKIDLTSLSRREPKEDENQLYESKDKSDHQNPSINTRNRSPIETEKIISSESNSRFQSLNKEIKPMKYIESPGKQQQSGQIIFNSNGQDNKDEQKRGVNDAAPKFNNFDALLSELEASKKKAKEMFEESKNQTIAFPLQNCGYQVTNCPTGIPDIQDFRFCEAKNCNDRLIGMKST